MPEIDEQINEAVERAEGGSRLNSAVALLVAITATLMALGNIKDGNIVQEMEKDESKAVDTWSYYQAKSIKQNIEEFGRDEMQVRLETTPGLTPEARSRYQQLLTNHVKQIERYDKEKAELMAQAKGYEADYDRLNTHDDQFDMAEAFFSIAISLAGITALTRKTWLFWCALAVSLVGLFFNLAGFLGWGFHPEALAKFFGA